MIAAFSCDNCIPALNMQPQTGKQSYYYYNYKNYRATEGSTGPLEGEARLKQLGAPAQIELVLRPTNGDALEVSVVLRDKPANRGEFVLGD